MVYRVVIFLLCYPALFAMEGLKLKVHGRSSSTGTLPPIAQHYLESIVQKPISKNNSEETLLTNSTASVLTVQSESKQKQATELSTSGSLKARNRFPSLPNIPELKSAAPVDLSQFAQKKEAHLQQVTEGLTRIIERRKSSSNIPSLPSTEISEEEKEEPQLIASHSQENVLAQLPRDIPSQSPVIPKNRRYSLQNNNEEQKGSKRKSSKTHKMIAVSSAHNGVPALKMNKVESTISSESPTKSHVRTRSATGVLMSPRMPALSSFDHFISHNQTIWTEFETEKMGATWIHFKSALRNSFEKMDEILQSYKTDLALKDKRIEMGRRQLEGLDVELAEAKAEESRIRQEREKLLKADGEQNDTVKTDFQQRDKAEQKLIKSKMVHQLGELNAENERLRTDIEDAHNTITLLQAKDLQAKDLLAKHSSPRTLEVLRLTEERDQLRATLEQLESEREEERQKQQTILDSLASEKALYEAAINQGKEALERKKSKKRPYQEPFFKKITLLIHFRKQLNKQGTLMKRLFQQSSSLNKINSVVKR